jgi:hypothetical protein
VPQKTAEWLLCPDYGSRMADLRTWLNGAKECAGRLHAIAEDLAALSGAAFWNANADSSWGSLQALADYALQNREELGPWNHFLRVRIKSTESGLDKLTALAEARALEPQELAPAFHFAFYNTLARSVLYERRGAFTGNGPHAGTASASVCRSGSGVHPALQRTRCGDYRSTPGPLWKPERPRADLDGDGADHE